MTAEPIDDGQVRPFAAILADIQRGGLLDHASAELQRLVAAVDERRAKGKLVLTIEVAPAKHDPSALAVTAGIKTTPPPGEPALSLFFTDKQKNLVRDDPRQAAIPGLRLAPSTANDTPKDIAK